MRLQITFGDSHKIILDWILLHLSDVMFVYVCVGHRCCHKALCVHMHLRLQIEEKLIFILEKLVNFFFSSLSALHMYPLYKIEFILKFKLCSIAINTPHKLG